MATDLILVKDIVGKDVIFSGPCLDGTYTSLAGTEIIVELSKLGIDAPLPVSLDDWLKWIDGAIDIVKGGLKIGAFFVPKAAPVLLTLSGVGAVVQAALKFIPRTDPDPVLVKLLELATTINAVEKKMHSTFAELLSFVTESEFTYGIITETSVLMRLMKACLKKHDAESIANFKEAYDKMCPLTLAYTMISLLEHKSTNPLVMAMAAEKVKTEETFKKWEKVIVGLIAELVLIEAFASGLLKKNNSYDLDRLREKAAEIENAMPVWEEEYKSRYWYALTELMKTYQEKHVHMNNEEKCRDLEKRLIEYSTYDRFYIFVFDPSEFKKEYSYICPNEKTQIIESRNKAGCTILIYRSRNSHKKTEEDYKKMSDEIVSCREGKMTHSENLTDVINGQLLEKNVVSKYGFVLLLDLRKYLSVGYISLEKEPGRYTNCQMNQAHNHWLFVAFD